jgi:hypothetical protein
MEKHIIGVMGMKSKSILSSASVLSGLLLAVLTNGISSHPSLEGWMHGRMPLVLSATGLLILAAIVLEASKTVDQAAAEGQELSGPGMAGALVLAAITWGVSGGVLGWAAGELLWPWARDYTPERGAAVWTFLVQAGPAQVCCVVVGFVAGERLKFADVRHTFILSVAGGVAGAGAGLVGASYASVTGPVELAPGLVLPVPAMAAAAVGASVAAFTAAFEPRVERQRQRAARLQAQANARRAEQERADQELFERTIVRLRRMGHDVRSGARKAFDPQQMVVDYVLNLFIGRWEPARKSQLKQVIREGTFDDAVQLMADVRAEKIRRPERREQERKEFVESLSSHWSYHLLRMGFDFLKEAEADAAVPSPPYVLVDEQNREHRIASLAGLAGYADELAIQPHRADIPRR